MVNFLIGDAINRLRVSILVRLSELTVLNSKFTKIVLNLLTDLGYIYRFMKVNFKYFRVKLKMKFQKNNIRQSYIISRPSSRSYFSLKNLKGGGLNDYHIAFNFLFISTPKGLVTDLESIFFHIGGEPVLAVN